MQIHIAVEVTFTVENNTVHSSQSILLNHVITLGQFINKCFMLSVSGRKLTCVVSSSVYMKDIRWLVTKNTCLFTVWGHFVYRRCCRWQWQCQSGKDVGCWFRSKEKQGFNEKEMTNWNCSERPSDWPDKTPQEMLKGNSMYMFALRQSHGVAAIAIVTLPTKTTPKSTITFSVLQRRHRIPPQHYI